MRTIYLGCDHGGYELKESLKSYMLGNTIKVIDLGSFSHDEVDYPDIAREVSEKVGEEPNSFGVLICATGIGMMMAANKRKGIRATVCTNELMATASRLHNDANVLCLGSKIIDLEMAKKILDIFLKTEFEGEEKHIRRLKKMEEGYNPDDCC